MMFEMSLPFGLRRQLKAHRAQLYRLACAWCGDEMLADDLVQECLLRAWRCRQQLRDGKKLDAWLFRILHNCWMEHLRRQRVDFELDEGVEGGEGPDAVFLQQQLIERVRHAVQQLPVGQRQVVTLVDLQELKYAEVAEILEIPIGTVMSRLSRGRKALRKALLDVHSSQMQTQFLRRVK